MSGSNLRSADLAMFAASGVSIETLTDAGVRRVTHREARDRCGLTFKSDHLEGLAFPYRRPGDGQILGWRVRRDHPEMESNGKPRAKYICSPDRRHLYFSPGAAPLLADTATPVIFVESEKAVLALTEAHLAVGRPVALILGTGGCWGWRGTVGRATDANGARVDEKGPLPDFDLIDWVNREVVIVFDANAATNPSVRAARRALATELQSRGARVSQVDLPCEDGVNGPDDFIARCGPEAFFALLVAASNTESDVFACTDAGNAEFFASRYAKTVRFDHAAQAWLIWSGHAWTRDRTGTINRFAKDALRARVRAATAIANEDERKRAIRWAIHSESRRGLDAIERLARSESPLGVTGDGWDRHPLLLGVQNGVLDLETGLLRDGRPEDGITRQMTVAFDPAARCPRFEQFLEEIFAGQSDLPQYLQRVIGYSLTGLTDEQKLWILYGTGANGKSTLVELLLWLWGSDLSWTMPFPSSTWSDANADYQKAVLSGRRLVTSAEVAKQGQLNEELVKSLTGGDAVNARHPYGRPFTFTPSAKFLIRVNDKPQIRDESHGMWRRIRLVPFARTFAIDMTLMPALRAEAAGILAWALRGCLDWQREGLGEPAVVQTATASYRDEQDQIASFLEARCRVLDGVSATAGALFASYREWANDNLHPADRLTQKAFGARLRGRFRFREGRNTLFYGVALLDEAQHRAEEPTPIAAIAPVFQESP